MKALLCCFDDDGLVNESRRRVLGFLRHRSTDSQIHRSTDPLINRFTDPPRITRIAASAKGAGINCWTKSSSLAPSSFHYFTTKWFLFSFRKTQNVPVQYHHTKVGSRRLDGDGPLSSA